MRSPKRISKAGVVNVASAKPPNRNNDTNSKAVSYIDEFVDNEVDCFSPRTLFASPSTPIQFSAISSEQDLLFDVPSNGPTPEAELLYHPWKMKTTMNGIAEGEDSFSNFPASSIISGQKRWCICSYCWVFFHVQHWEFSDAVSLFQLSWTEPIGSVQHCGFSWCFYFCFFVLV